MFSTGKSILHSINVKKLTLSSLIAFFEHVAGAFRLEIRYK